MQDIRIVISNCIPPPRHVDDGPVDCQRCGRLVTPNWIGGNFFPEIDCWWTCDTCGAAERPELMPLLERLRAFASGDFTVTRGGVNLNENDRALDCPVCEQDNHADDRDRQWLVVATADGRALCAACSADVDPSLLALREALNDVCR